MVSFCAGSIQDIIVGMKQIFISRDALITDYFVLANISAAFFNAACVLLIEFCILLYEKLMFTGLILAALYINVGFSLFG